MFSPSSSISFLLLKQRFCPNLFKPVNKQAQPRNISKNGLRHKGCDHQQDKNDTHPEQDSKDLLERVDWLFNLFANDTDEEKSSKKDKNKKEKEKKDKKKSKTE